LKNHGGASGTQSLETCLHDDTGLPGQLLKELNDKQRRHSLLFSTIHVRFKANLSVLDANWKPDRQNAVK
jgi:hypothetical protein